MSWEVVPDRKAPRCDCRASPKHNNAKWNPALFLDRDHIQARNLLEMRDIHGENRRVERQRGSSYQQIDKRDANALSSLFTVNLPSKQCGFRCVMDTR